MPDENLPPRWTVLRPRDQAVIATGVVIALALLLVGWLFAGFRTQVNLDTTPKQSARFIVDINAAGWPEIAQLPGVGETLARRIVESREVEGPFRELSDLGRVRGVGKNTLERIRPYLKPPS